MGGGHLPPDGSRVCVGRTTVILGRMYGHRCSLRLFEITDILLHFKRRVVRKSRPNFAIIVHLQKLVEGGRDVYVKNVVRPYDIGPTFYRRLQRAEVRHKKIK